MALRLLSSKKLPVVIALAAAPIKRQRLAIHMKGKTNQTLLTNLHPLQKKQRGSRPPRRCEECCDLRNLDVMFCIRKIFVNFFRKITVAGIGSTTYVRMHSGLQTLTTDGDANHDVLRRCMKDGSVIKFLIVYLQVHSALFADSVHYQVCARLQGRYQATNNRYLCRLALFFFRRRRRTVAPCRNYTVLSRSICVIQTPRQVLRYRFPQAYQDSAQVSDLRSVVYPPPLPP
eukprot:284815981_3